MKFTVSTSALLRAVQVVATTIEKNPVVPVLENIWFGLVDGQLTLRASNLETTLTHGPISVEGTGTAEALLPAQLLVRTLSQLPDGPLVVTLDDEAYNHELRLSRNRYRFSGENPKDFPRTPVVAADNVPSVELAPADLVGCLAATAPFVSTDMLRPAMTGVYLHAHAQGPRLVATDGHRLLWIGLPGTVGLPPLRSCILPGLAARRLLELTKAAAKETNDLVSLRWNHSNLRAQIGNTELVAKLVDERYPDYENIIPVAQTTHLSLDSAGLTASLRRLGLFANTTTHRIRLDVGDKTELKVSALDYDFGRDAEEFLPVAHTGESMAIGFSSKMLQEVLALYPGKVRCGLSTPNRAMTLAPEEGQDGPQALVMPQMLDNY